MRLEIVLVVTFVLHESISSEWQCTPSTDFRDDNGLFSLSTDPIPDQCTITVEYRHQHAHEKQVCTAHTLTISSLPSPSFSPNHTMQTFKLNSCQLSGLGQLPFSLPSSVERLDLSSNALSTFVLSFPLSSNLKYLHLDHNPNLIDMNFGHQRVQQQLVGLSLRHNRHVRLSSLPSHLTQLDLSHCHLPQSVLSTLLLPLSNLTHLSLAGNQLERLPSIDERMQLAYLNLSNNRLATLDNGWLPRQLATLDLRFNQIRSLEFLQHTFDMRSARNETSNAHDQVRRDQRRVVVIDVLANDVILCDEAIMNRRIRMPRGYRELDRRLTTSTSASNAVK